MTRKICTGSREEQAACWFVRLQDCDDEAVWIEHRDWLESDRENKAAYAAVERAWIDVENFTAIAGEPGDAVDLPREATIVELAEYRSPSRRWTKLWVPAAAAAAIAAVLAIPNGGRLWESPGETFRTDVRREIALEDGSRLTLDRRTEVTIRFERNRRKAELVSGHAAFDVRHDADRPFMVTAGDREVRVLGTEFDVLARDGAFGVSVRRGLVSVSGNGTATRLPAGTALLRLPGSGTDEVTTVSAENALAWREGRLTYLNSPLTTVAKDYERYVGRRVSVAPSVRDLRISGTVRARDEDELIQQLELLLPVRVLQTTDGGREIRHR